VYPVLRQIPIRRGSKPLFRSDLPSDIENSRQPWSRRYRSRHGFGNDYTGTSLAQILDVDGNVVFSAEVTNAGKRILVELP
jgi:hypothetical protein